MSFFVVKLAENIMRRKPFLDFSHDSIFFHNLTKNIFFKRHAVLKLARPWVPVALFIAAVFAPLME